MRMSNVARSDARHATPGPVRMLDRQHPPGTCVVFVVDDDPSVRKSLDRLLRSVGYQVQTYDSARAFMGRSPLPTTDTPQCIILDVRMPGVSGLELQTSLRNSGSRIPIVFSTGFGDVTSSVRAMKIGAVDFLTKPIDEEQLLSAVDRGLSLDVELRRVDAVMSSLKGRLGRLTPRERQVFALVVTGLLNKQIAGRLGTCERTIKVHRARIMKKMEAGSVAELVRMAVRLGPVVEGSDASAAGTKEEPNSALMLT
jgi:FixJ family two-component response regulator